jgi:hypothetical protein
MIGGADVSRFAKTMLLSTFLNSLLFSNFAAVSPAACIEQQPCFDRAKPQASAGERSAAKVKKN